MFVIKTFSSLLGPFPQKYSNNIGFFLPAIIYNVSCFFLLKIPHLSDFIALCDAMRKNNYDVIAFWHSSPQHDVESKEKIPKVGSLHYISIADDFAHIVASNYHLHK